MDPRTHSRSTGTTARRRITAAKALERITGRVYRALPRWVTTVLLG